MSLLFDALRRTQGSSSGAGSAQTALAAPRVPGILRDARFVVPVLLALAAILGWYFYEQSRYSPISTPHTMSVVDAVSSVQAPPVAASGVSDTNATLAQAGAQATDAAADKGKPWTQPIADRKHRHNKRKPVPKPTQLQVNNDQDALQEGYLALSEGRLDQAEQKYLAVLAQHPHEKDALLGLAVVAHRKMQMERAAALYRQVLREDIGNAVAAAGLVSLSSQADPMTAESQLKELLDIKPTAHELHYALGGALARQQRWGEAQQAFFRACKLEPGNALYAYNLAVSLDRLHQPTAALTLYQKALRLAKPRDPTLDLDAIGHRIQELSKAEAH